MSEAVVLRQMWFRAAYLAFPNGASEGQVVSLDQHNLVIVARNASGAQPP